VAFTTVRGGKTYRGLAAYVTLLFSWPGLIFAIYILIGVFYNTVPPHFPSTAASFTSLHSWIQYVISIVFWPLSFWHPTFTVGKWTPTGSITSP
jgi:hypothetical protein